MIYATLNGNRVTETTALLFKQKAPKLECPSPFSDLQESPNSEAKQATCCHAVWTVLHSLNNPPNFHHYRTTTLGPYYHTVLKNASLQLSGCN